MKHTFSSLLLSIFFVLNSFGQNESIKLYTVDYKTSIYNIIPDKCQSEYNGISRYEIYTDKVVEISYSDSLETIVSSSTTKLFDTLIESSTLIIDSIELNNNLARFFDKEQAIFRLLAKGNTIGSYVQLSSIEIDFLFGEKIQYDGSGQNSTGINILPDAFIKKVKKLPKTIALEVEFTAFPNIDTQIFILYQLDNFQNHRQ